MKFSHKINKINYFLIVFIITFFISFFCTNVFSEIKKQKEDHINQKIIKKNDNKFISIDFNNVDIKVFIKFISELTGKNFIIDNRVKGKVTVISPTKISTKEAFRVFESVLEVHGFTTVKSGTITKIIASPDARSKNIETRLYEEHGEAEDRVVTQMIPLQYANPNEVKRLFAPLVSKNSVILSYPPSNMLIITDMYSNIKRLLKIIKAIDNAGIGQQISIIPILYGDANQLVKILNTVFKSQRRIPKSIAEKSIKFVADLRTNTIVFLASEGNTLKIKKLIKMLDKQVPTGKEKIHVYYLEHATAEDLAAVLQSLPTKSSSSPNNSKQAPVVSAKVLIKADKATNSLIIMAEKDEYIILENIIKKLDIPRSMVYIECLIMEINVDKDFNLGTEWRVGEDTTINGSNSVYGGGFSGSPGAGSYQNTRGLAQGMLPAGFSMGILAPGTPIKIGDVEIPFPNAAMIVQAYKTDKDVNILSTPQIMTTDNEEAVITVGKNVPYLTKTGTTSTSETYNSYEYKDVGISLKITPQISKGGLIRLKIAQEVTKLDNLSQSILTDRPTTFKRTINTTVIVQDKSTVVIGGLIDDSFSNSTFKVPCLGDIPGIGWLFKTVSKSNEKTNLYVFLTPTVIYSPSDATSIYKTKHKEISIIREGSIKLYEQEHIMP